MMHLGPVVYVYSIVWNDEYMLPYFFRHYDSIANKYVLYDNHSSDSSVAIMQQNPKVEIREIEFDTDSVCEKGKNVKNDCWKESKEVADWVIVLDVDEHIYHPNLMDFLTNELQAGTTLVKTVGYDMVSEERPTGEDRLVDLVHTGVRNGDYDKVFFNPKQIKEIGYLVGSHVCRPQGVIRYSAEQPYLLHYKYLGRKETFHRNRTLGERLRPKDRARSWGWQYGMSEEWFDKDFNGKLGKAKVLNLA